MTRWRLNPRSSDSTLEGSFLLLLVPMAFAGIPALRTMRPDEARFSWGGLVAWSRTAGQM